jgi:hypothetical protein
MAGGAIVDYLIKKAKLGNLDGIQMFFDVFMYLLIAMIKEFIFSPLALFAILGIIFKLIFNFKEVYELLSETTQIADIVAGVFTRDAQHALPERSKQPMRSVELNVVLYNGVDEQPETSVINLLRLALWFELLGQDFPPDILDVPALSEEMKWVEFWNTCAAANEKAMKNNEALPEGHTPKILKWTGDTDAKEYLETLKIRTKGLRSKAHEFHFDNCRFETRHSLLAWLI